MQSKSASSLQFSLKTTHRRIGGDGSSSNNVVVSDKGSEKSQVSEPVSDGLNHIAETLHVSGGRGECGAGNYPKTGKTHQDLCSLLALFE